MVEEDDFVLSEMNQRRDVSTQCTEDQFEEVINFFEEAVQAKQPFPTVDSPIISYAEMEASFDGVVEENVRKFAKDIYEHWKSRRMQAGNRPFGDVVNEIGELAQSLIAALNH